MLVNIPNACAQKLGNHMDKTTHSYKDLVLGLANENEMNAAVDFYIGAASMYLDILIFLLKPKQVRWHGKVTYEFFQEPLFTKDENRPLAEFKIWLMFNGVNHYTPFHLKELSDLINTGYLIMQKVSTLYQNVKELLDRVPKNTKLNGALTQMAIHLWAGTSIANTVRFKSGVGDTSSVATLPYPLEMGVPETVLCK